MKPLVIDVYCGVGGWSAGFLAEGWDCIGIDIEQHVYGAERYPGQLIIQDALTLHGSQFRDAHCLVMSPPCQFFSYTSMPWSRAKQLAREVRADPDRMEKELALFNACFRIQREACEAAGRHIPMVVENVRGAQPWVGPAAWHHGSFFLWGDLPALMPIALTRTIIDGNKGVGPNWKQVQAKKSSSHWTNPVEQGRKFGGDWFGSGDDCSLQRRSGSRTKARKAASAMIAKIPEALSRHIARTYMP